ncbi:MAG: prepilin-type N-terminal cleavage/methylation domain-containing protein, partial [Methylophilaceae bacterium]
MSDVKQSSVMNCKGYTFIELMVALAVSSIVIAGSYAGYSLLARQQQFLNAQTSLDRNALRVVDLIQSDIRMAGYNDLKFDPMDRLNAVKVASSNDDLLLIYDDYDEFKNPYRALVHYY